MGKVFEIAKKVAASHIDELGHVNNVVYLSWAQDIANLHWSELQNGFDTSAYVWVVLRHEIDYKGQAKLHDELVIRTWVGDTAGIKSIRHIEISNKGAVIVTIKTTWCLVDAQSMRPKRITGDILKILKVHS